MIWWLSWRNEICRLMRRAELRWQSGFLMTSHSKAMSLSAMLFNGDCSMAMLSRTRERSTVSKISSARLTPSRQRTHRRTKELGDFQTPIELAIECVKVISRFKFEYGRILEPTCGRGSFLLAATKVFEQSLDLLGVEIQPRHAEEARRLISQSVRPDVTWRVHVGDIFDYDLKNLVWNSVGHLLVLGNPPWVTSSDLGAMDAVNVPEKSNFRSLRGIEALTGESNFDVAEYVWLRLLLELQSSNPTIVMLSKTSVARRVLSAAAQLGLPVAESMMWRIDAKTAFDVAVNACLFAIRLEESEANYYCQVFDSLSVREPATTMGIVDGTLVVDVASHAVSRRFDGTSPVEWRQGIKHDLAAVMELRESIDHVLRNGLDETVQIEPEWVYPLLKGSDVNAGRKPSRKVIVTQRSLSDSPQSLQHTAPLLWRYLQSHSDRFRARRSSIYSNRSDFSMFGVGGLYLHILESCCFRVAQDTEVSIGRPHEWSTRST